jgi:AraC family transcriptional regulator, melibiose operon regulatory protein
MPDRDLGAVLTNRPIIFPPAAGRDVEPMFESRRDDLVGGETQAIALLEAHALVRRLLQYHLLQQPELDTDRWPSLISSDTTRRVTAMAQFVVTHFREPLCASAIADSAHLNTNYAMTLFRATVGTTIDDYLTRCRVAKAQRLLITTSMTTVEIAYAAGFGSQSSFYVHFATACGCSPGRYRHHLR